MGSVLSAYIFPHPPIIIPEVGRGEEAPASKTIEACKLAAKDIRIKKPDTIVVITPHGPAFRDAVGISVEPRLDGSFKNFRRPDVKINLENDIELVDNILKESREFNIPIVGLEPELLKMYGINSELDHGAMVPLYYISKELDGFKIVHVCMGFLSFDELYGVGSAIRRAVEQSGREAVIVASGDLSHKLTSDAPCGYSEKGREFDEQLVKLLGEGDFKGVMSMEEELIEEAGQCGLRPFAIMFGCLGDVSVKTEILSYEGPFGVGYCVAKLEANSQL